MKSYREFAKAPKAGVEVRVEGNVIRVFFDFKEITSNVKEEGQTKVVKQLEAECVDVKGGREYKDIVSAIVNDRYSNDDVQAILANYTEVTPDLPLPAGLTPEKRDEHIKEYNEFQQWRKTAKEVAKKVLEILK